VPTIDATFTDPRAVRIDHQSGTWFLLGAGRANEAAVGTLTSSEDGEQFCRRHNDALVVFVEQTNGNAERLHAWKGVFATSELFFSVRPNGDVVLSDHFLNVLAALPTRDRAPDERGLTAHYLFRKPIGRLSYSAAITRLSHAEHLRIDLRTGDAKWSLFDRIAADAEARSPAEYVAAVDGALARSFDNTPTDGSTAIMFSGGVDSTLLMTYVHDSARPITFVPDTPEFQPETSYAREAISLFGTQSHEIPIPESRFVDLLEATTDALGMPAFDDAVPYFADLILTQPDDAFIIGQGADSAFGMGLKLTRFASWFRWPGVRGVLNSTAPHVPGHLGYRLRQVAPIATGFSKEPLDPDGYAGNTRYFGDTSLFQSLADPAVITEVKVDQLEYVTRRLERTADPKSTFLSHIELAHWMVVFGNPPFLERQIAHSRGKRIIAPYVDSLVLSELARVPIDERYMQGPRAKWILKDLLGQRLPGYPVDQRKKATALPYERFYRHGPLTGIWDRYDVPELFSGKNRDALVAAPSTSTWNAITYAVWEQRVVNNPDLRPHPASQAASFVIGDV